ncbi:MAG: CHAT domain-containing protein [Cyanobacteria bacterium P01_A01_bin.105]
MVQTPAAVAQISDGTAATALDQGKKQYQNGQITAAVETWQAALALAPADLQVQLHRYLSIAYQDLGQWSAAETALTAALAVAQQQHPPDRLVQAQLLNTQGRLQFNLAETNAALDSWQAAEAIYQQLNNSQGMVLAQINQAQALRSLGHYRQARQLLTQLAPQLDALHNPTLAADLKRSLGATLIAIGDLDDARQLLHESLEHSQDSAAATHYQLGRVYQALNQPDKALAHYGMAATAPQRRVAIESQLAALKLLVTVDPAAAAARVMPLRSQLRQLAPSRWTLYGQINLADSWVQLTHQSSIPVHHLALSMAQLLAHTIQQAETLQDTRAESAARIALGHLYEQTQQWSPGLALTDQAIALATPLRADDLLVKAQWQRGRFLKAQGHSQAAITAYEAAVTKLKQLRQDLVTMNPEVQFSFRKQVEPIYRELAQLLFEQIDTLPQPQQQQRLTQARSTIEALQLAELQNFFREACRTYQAQSIESIDPNAAVIDAIVLGQSLEVIFARPGQPLQHHRTVLAATELTDTVNALRQSLNPAFLASESQLPGQRLYGWLLQPFEAAVADSQTLVFVLDDFLRDIPMAVLYDGQQYLIENHAVVLTPGLQLFESAPLNQNLTTLVGGITQARQGFSALPGVADEITEVQQKVSAQLLVDQGFTRDLIQQELARRDFSIVHLGTHGQFSSQLDQTFLLTWDDRIGSQDLRQWLRQDHTPLELLILSACQTAKGDDRATLGLAGLTIQAGARSAVATLWSVQDRSTVDLMTALYDTLTNGASSRAEALQKAQLQLLHSDQFFHPYHWAGFVLVGNWL